MNLAKTNLPIAILLMLTVLLAACSRQAGQATATRTPTPTPATTHGPSPTSAPIPVFTVVAPGPTQTPTPTKPAGLTGLPTAPPLPTPTATPKATATPRRTATPTPTSVKIPTRKPSKSLLPQKPEAKQIRLTKAGSDPVSEVPLHTFNTTDVGITISGSILNAPKDSRLSVRWTPVDVEDSSTAFSMTQDATKEKRVRGSQPFQFTLHEDLPLPTGEYKASVLLNGLPLTSEKFRVVAPLPRVLARPASRLPGAPKAKPRKIVPTDLEFILDASRSMLDPVQNVAKIESAKDSMQRLITALPKNPNLNVGLRAYASRYATGKSRSCRDTRLLVPMKGVETSKLREQVNGIDAVGGYTPMAYSIEQAAGDFPKGKTRNAIVLVSDGIETCVDNPVERIKTAAKHKDITVYVVGFHVPNQEGRKQLQEIAHSTGGIYVDANTPRQLEAALKNIVEKQVKVIRVQGGTGRLSISVPSDSKFGEYKILNSDGKNVGGASYTPTERSDTTDSYNLPAGMYTVEWSASGSLNPSAPFRVEIAGNEQTTVKLGALRIVSKQRPSAIVLVNRDEGRLVEKENTGLSKVPKNGFLDAPLALPPGHYTVYFQYQSQSNPTPVGNVEIRSGTITELDV